MNENLDKIVEIREKLKKLQNGRDATIKEIRPLVNDHINYWRGRNDPNPSVQVKFQVLDGLNEEISDALAEYSALSLATSEEWLRHMATSADKLESLTKKLNDYTKGLLLATVILLGVTGIDLLLRIGGHV